MQELRYAIRALLKTAAHKVGASLECTIPKLKAQGPANAQIAARIGVSDMSVGRLLKRKGWVEPRVTLKPARRFMAVDEKRANPTEYRQRRTYD